MVKLDSQNHDLMVETPEKNEHFSEESPSPVAGHEATRVREFRDHLGDEVAASDSFYGNHPTPVGLPAAGTDTDQMDNYSGHEEQKHSAPGAEDLDAPLSDEVLPEEPDELLGTTIARKYELTQLLGVGAMGRIYRAIQHPISRTVAVKVLHKDLVTDQRKKMIEKRFEREARAASSINHENTIEIYDFGNTDDGLLYLVMEFIDGCDLSDLIERESPMSPERTVHIARQILLALQAAHDSNIAHRDLKPENVMLTDKKYRQDFVKVCDFGIAKVLPTDNTQEETKLTQFGMVCGTPYYMSPEQARAQDLDARTDLYSMGVILYEMLTGHVPFQGNTPVEVIARHLTENAPRPSERYPDLQLPVALEDVVMKALEKNRDKRYASAGEFLEALDASLLTKEETVVSSELLDNFVAPQLEAADFEADETPSNTFASARTELHPQVGTGLSLEIEEVEQPKSKLPLYLLSGLIMLVGIVGLAVWIIQSSKKKNSDSNAIQIVKNRNAVRTVGRLVPSAPSRVISVPIRPLSPDNRRPVVRRVVVRRRPVARRRVVIVRKRPVKRRVRVVPRRVRRPVVRRVALAVRKRAPVPRRRVRKSAKGKYRVLYRSFRSWRRRKKVNISDMGSLGRAYTKASDLADDGQYASASKMLAGLMKTLKSSNGIPREVAKRKFDRLRRTHARAKQKRTATSRSLQVVENQLFPKIFFAFSRRQYKKMNSLMNTAFAMMR